MSQAQPLLPGTIARSAAVQVRTLENTDVKADPPGLANADFDPLAEGVVTGAGWKTLLVFARFEQGTNPTVLIEPLLLVQADANESSSWVRLPKTAALEDGQPAIVNVMGRRLFLRMDAITGSPAKLTLLVAGYEPFRYAGPTRD